MKRRWRLAVDLDWELVLVAVWATWVALGDMAIVVTGAIFNDKVAVNLAGAITMLGLVGIPLLAAATFAVRHLMTSQVIRREWQSGPDLRDYYRSE